MFCEHAFKLELADHHDVCLGQSPTWCIESQLETKPLKTFHSPVGTHVIDEQNMKTQSEPNQKDTQDHEEVEGRSEDVLEPITQVEL